jgi:cob(I)alamin adenosyltransferase
MDDATQADAGATPQIKLKPIDVPEGLIPLLGLAAAQITESDPATNKVSLKPVSAFELCLFLAKNDTRLAAEHLLRLLDSIDQWNDTLKGNEAFVKTPDFPFP